MSGGSKMDFLEGEDVGSISSSYSSINGPTLNRLGDSKQINSMSRFNPARSSFISKSSSKLDNDSASIREEDNNDEFNDENNSGEFDRDSANGSSSFQRRNSSRNLGGFNRQNSRRSYLSQNKNVSDFGIDNSNDNSTSTSNNQTNETVKPSGLHIAPLLPFTSTSTPTLTPRDNADAKSNNHHSANNQYQTQSQRHPIINSTIDEEMVAPNLKSPNKEQKNKQPTDSFASIFTASLSENNNLKTDDLKTQQNSSRSTLNQSPGASISSGIDSYNGNKSNLANTSRTDMTFRNDADMEQNKSPKSLNKSTYSNQAIPSIRTSTKSLKQEANDEDDDHIDWASSEDEEIVKKEIATFERNQVRFYFMNFSLLLFFWFNRDPSFFFVN